MNPFISCLMPTANRRAFMPRAIAYFLHQDYEPKELRILDDGADLVPDDPRVRYRRLERRLSLGAKRNRCVELARGDLLMHWDWHAPSRIAVQAAACARCCSTSRPPAAPGCTATLPSAGGRG